MFCVLTLALIVGGTRAEARKPGDPLKPGFNLFSKQQDVQLGQEVAAKVRDQYPLVDNSFLADYLKRVVTRLAAAREVRDSGFEFSCTILNDPEIEAFALPGGPLFVNTGLVKVLDNEAQLAAVMAHEMSHVILRHGTHAVSKGGLIELPALLAESALGDDTLLSRLAQAGIGFTANSVLLRFSRDAESQADALGAHLMAAAGYDPIEMARFFDKLEGTVRGPQFLSDHPNPGNRKRAIQDEVQHLPLRKYGYETGRFRRARAVTAKLPAPPRKQAAAPANPQ